MADKRVAVVVGDIGGTVELIPGVQELQRRGVSVQWIVDPGGKGFTKLDAENIPWIERDALLHIAEYDLILVGTSATAVKEQIEWTRAGRAIGWPVLWYEDLWGTGERPATRSVDPDVMLVVDEVAGRIARNVRPNVRIEVVGKPTFEYLHDMDQQKIAELRREYRQKMEVRSQEDGGVFDEFSLVYWGGGELDRVVSHMAELHDVAVGNGFLLAPRLHPKMPARAAMWRCLRCMFYELALFDAHGEAWTEPGLNCAADAVLGEFGSTQTYGAALVGTKPIIALWPDNKQKRLDCGFIDGDPPLIAEGIGVGVESKEDFASVIPDVIFVGDDERNKTFRRAREVFGQAIQPGAAGRIADAVMKYL